MHAVREAWTDERLDDLNGRVDKGFDRVDADIRELRSQMSKGFERMDARFDALQRTLVIGCIGFAGSLAASVIATATLT
jgi:hypothetical protein